MCQSAAEGGLRCATETRPAFEALVGHAATEHPTTVLARLDADPEAVIAYAATPSGEQAIREKRDELDAIYEAQRNQMTGEERSAFYGAQMDVSVALSRAILDGRTRRQAADEVRRIIRAHQDANPAADTSAITADSPVITTVTDLSEGAVALGDQIEGRTVVALNDCSYCGGKNVPLVDTNEGRLPVPHRSNSRNTTCQWGDTVAPISVRNTLR